MRKYFTTGLALLLPIALTLLIIVSLFDFFTAPLVTPVSYLLTWVENRLDFHIASRLTLLVSRFLALLLLFVFLIILGGIARWIFIKDLLKWTNQIFSRIPLIKTVYKVSRDILQALFSTDGKKIFKRPLFVPFPSKDCYCLGFESGEVAKEIQEKIQKPLICVFVPTAPHPISGFLFLVEKNLPQTTAMTNEEALKFLVSCGMVYTNSSNHNPPHPPS